MKKSKYDSGTGGDDVRVGGTDDVGKKTSPSQAEVSAMPHAIYSEYSRE